MLLEAVLIELFKLKWIEWILTFNSFCNIIFISPILFRILPTRGPCHRVSFTRQHRPSTDSDCSTDGRLFDFVDAFLQQRIDNRTVATSRRILSSAPCQRKRFSDEVFLESYLSPSPTAAATTTTTTARIHSTPNTSRRIFLRRSVRCLSVSHFCRHLPSRRSTSGTRRPRRNGRNSFLRRTICRRPSTPSSHPVLIPSRLPTSVFVDVSTDVCPNDVSSTRIVLPHSANCFRRSDVPVFCVGGSFYIFDCVKRNSACAANAPPHSRCVLLQRIHISLLGW